MAASAPELGSSLTRVPHCSPLLVLALHTAPGTQRDSTHVLLWDGGSRQGQLGLQMTQTRREKSDQGCPGLARQGVVCTAQMGRGGLEERRGGVGGGMETERSPRQPTHRAPPGLGAERRPWFLVLSKPTVEQRKATGCSPVVPLFAELLLKVAQGQTLGLQHPPVGDLLPAEEISDHQLAGLERVHPCQLLGLLVAENETEKLQVQHLKVVRVRTHAKGVCKLSSEVRLQLCMPRALGRGPALGESPLVGTQSSPSHLCRAHRCVCAANGGQSNVHWGNPQGTCPKR